MVLAPTRSLLSSPLLLLSSFFFPFGQLSATFNHQPAVYLLLQSLFEPLHTVSTQCLPHPGIHLQTTRIHPQRGPFSSLACILCSMVENVTFNCKMVHYLSSRRRVLRRLSLDRFHLVSCFDFTRGVDVLYSTSLGLLL